MRVNSRIWGICFIALGIASAILQEGNITFLLFTLAMGIPAIVINETEMD